MCAGGTVGGIAIILVGIGLICGIILLRHKLKIWQLMLSATLIILLTANFYFFFSVSFC